MPIIKQIRRADTKNYELIGLNYNRPDHGAKSLANDFFFKSFYFYVFKSMDHILQGRGAIFIVPFDIIPNILNVISILAVFLINN